MRVNQYVTMSRAFSDDEVVDALRLVTRVGKNSKNPRPIGDLSRVNEQELFAVFTYLSLKDERPNLASKFIKAFRLNYDKFSKIDPIFGIYEACRVALQEVKRSDGLSGQMIKDIRLTALGKSQLDTMRDQVDIRRVTDGENNTAVRAIRTALKKVNQNSDATEDELKSFRLKNIDRRKNNRILH